MSRDHALWIAASATPLWLCAPMPPHTMPFLAQSRPYLSTFTLPHRTRDCAIFGIVPSRTPSGAIPIADIRHKWRSIKPNPVPQLRHFWHSRPPCFRPNRSQSWSSTGA